MDGITAGRAGDRRTGHVKDSVVVVRILKVVRDHPIPETLDVDLDVIDESRTGEDNRHHGR